VVTEYPVTADVSNLHGITAGPDGALWVTEANGNIGRITTAGAVTWYPVPTPKSSPFTITQGPDGALWFTDGGSNAIGRITTAGVIAEYPIPTADSQPTGITAGPDGALWFTEAAFTANRIGRIATTGAITEYAAPPCCGNASLPSMGLITAGPDGALWFTSISHIGRVTTSGLVTVYPTPGIYGNYPITRGSDGALWFAASGYVTTVIGRAPACGLGFSASYANGALTMNFDLGIDTPSTFSIAVINSNGRMEVPFSEEIAPVVPPRPFTLTWNPFPDLGKVTVQPTLATPPGGPGLGLCSEWTIVNTAQ